MAFAGLAVGCNKAFANRVRRAGAAAIKGFGALVKDPGEHGRFFGGEGEPDYAAGAVFTRAAVGADTEKAAGAGRAAVEIVVLVAARCRFAGNFINVVQFFAALRTLIFHKHPPC